VIVESEVLLRVEYFEQCRRRITAEIHAHFVNLVQAEDRIVGFGLAQTLDNFPWQCSDVSPSVTADFGLIPHTAQRKTNEVSP
jgi:hypothetical protein